MNLSKLYQWLKTSDVMCYADVDWQGFLFLLPAPPSISSEEPDISHPNSFLNPISYLVLFKHNLSSIYRVGEVGGVMNESMRMLSIIYQFPLFLIWIECGEDRIWKGLTVNRFWIGSGWLLIEWYHLVSSDQFCFAEATKVMIECLGDGQSGE